MSLFLPYLQSQSSLLTLQLTMVSTSGRIKTEITGTAMVPRMNISAKVIMPLIRIPVN